MIELLKQQDVWDLLTVRRRAWQLALPPPNADDVWDRLQQPARRADLEPQYRLLRSALDNGWRIEEPIYLRPRWSGSRSHVYHFILRHATQTAPRLLTAPHSADIERFVRDEGLRVLRSR